MKTDTFLTALVSLAIALGALGCAKSEPVRGVNGLTDDEIENIVRRSYQYVAMYNVNNKFAMKQGGWNTVAADTELKDHTMREIARPNNDTLYIGCMLDLRAEPVEGIDRIFEASGDFVSAVFRVMPHAKDPERFERVVDQMQSVRLMTLSEYRGGEALAATDPGFPPVGRTDFDTFGDNLLEVMQFVFNHTTFDPANEVDQAVLAGYAPLGVEPGKSWDADGVAPTDGAKFRQIAERVWAEEMAKSGTPEGDERYMLAMFKPQGQIGADVLLFQSVLGPIGLPAQEAVYPAIATSDGEPMSAMNDYVIRMDPDEMPAAGAFWSVTLYDVESGFFIPNDRKKYSVGANAGMQLDEDGGIAIYIAAEQPPGVPEENWLPINREDVEIGPIMRLYEPDLERFATWTPPKAERL